MSAGYARPAIHPHPRDDSALAELPDRLDPLDPRDPAPRPSNDSGRIRHLPADVSFAAETEARRNARRQRLCACDGLLSLVEEHNATAPPGTPLPAQYLGAYRRLGGTLPLSAVRDGAVMIEAVFALQEECLIQPVLPRRVRAESDRSTRRLSQQILRVLGR